MIGWFDGRSGGVDGHCAREMATVARRRSNVSHIACTCEDG